jgi:nuclear inhibitor of protein phosphatase 1
MSIQYQCPGWATKARQPCWLRVEKNGAEVDRLLLAEKALLLGRKVPNEPSRGTVRLDHDSISREHAVLLHAHHGATFVCDLGSRFGTTVDGTKLEAKKYTEVKEGAVILFGASTRNYVFTKVAAASGAPSGRERICSQADARLGDIDGGSAVAGSGSARAKAAAATQQRVRASMDEEEDPMAEYVDDDEDVGDGSGSGEGGDEASRAARRAEKERRRQMKAAEKGRRKEHSIA